MRKAMSSLRLIVAAVGLVIVMAQPAKGPVFIAGDRPVTEDQVRQKLESEDGQTYRSCATADISKPLHRRTSDPVRSSWTHKPAGSVRLTMRTMIRLGVVASCRKRRLGY